MTVLEATIRELVRQIEPQLELVRAEGFDPFEVDKELLQILSKEEIKIVVRFILAADSASECSERDILAPALLEYVRTLISDNQLPHFVVQEVFYLKGFSRESMTFSLCQN